MERALETEDCFLYSDGNTVLRDVAVQGQDSRDYFI